MPINYVTPPRKNEKKVVGNKRCGEILLDVSGGITAEEAVLIQRILSGIETPYQKIARLAVTMASRERIQLEGRPERCLSNIEAYDIILNSINNDHDNDTAREIAIRYANEIAEISAYINSYSNRKTCATVAAIIKSRLAEDHTYDDTLKMDFELVQLIFNEANASEVEDEERQNSPPSEESLGK